MALSDCEAKILEYLQDHPSLTKAILGSLKTVPGYGQYVITAQCNSESSCSQDPEVRRERGEDSYLQLFFYRASSEKEAFRRFWEEAIRKRKIDDFDFFDYFFTTATSNDMEPDSSCGREKWDRFENPRPKKVYFYRDHAFKNKDEVVLILETEEGESKFLTRCFEFYYNAYIVEKQDGCFTLELVKDGESIVI